MKLRFIYLLGIVLFSCDTVDSNKTLSFDEAKLQWEAVGVDSYYYTFNTLCFCDNSAVDIYVEKNKVVAVYKAGTDDKLVNYDPDEVTPESTWRYPTIDDLFDLIVEEEENGHTVRAEFDPIFGMPVRIVVNEEQMAWDGGYALHASQLERIK